MARRRPREKSLSREKPLVGRVACRRRLISASPARLWRAISVHRMGYEDAGAKQPQNCRDCFNHFDTPNLLLRTFNTRRLFHDGFVDRHNGFVTGLGTRFLESGSLNQVPWAWLRVP